MQLGGKIAVVTGAASGIGQALAVEAARRGSHVAVVDIDAPDGTVDAIRLAGGAAEGFVCDISVPGDVADLAIQVERRFGAVHVLAANAGLALQGSLDTTTYEDFERVLRTNVLGTFACVRSFVPVLRRTAEESSGAAVLITGSEHSLGVPANQHSAAYTTSKHALLGLADVARGDLAGSDISVTLLCPGWTLVTKVAAFVDADPEVAARIRPIAQTPDAVARFGWNALEAGTFLAASNPASREQAMRRVDEISAAFDRV